MMPDGILAAVAGLIAVGAILLPLRRRGLALMVLLVCATAVVFAAMNWQGSVERRTQAKNANAQKVPKTQGNPGYVTSDQCASCHPGQHQSWHDSYHRRMTQYAGPDTVLGDFNDRDFEVDGNRIRLQRRGEEFWAEMVDPDWTHDQMRARAGWPGYQQQVNSQAPRVWRQVGLTTGSHHFQAYWVASKFGNLQFGFPLAWLVEDQRWAPRKDTFIRDPEAASPHQIWNINCIQCHATAGVPSRDGNTGLLSSRAGEMGISCEACHGPGEKHIEANRNPLRRYLLHGRSKPDDTIVNPRRLNPRASTQACGQCHGMKYVHDFDNYLKAGFSFRPGGEIEPATPLLRHPRFGATNGIPAEILSDAQFINNIFWPDGMIRITGREYSGLVESACHLKGGMTCLSCHSMHDSDPDRQLAARGKGNQACLQCHARFEKDISAHTHHAAGSSGSVCYNCHMPSATYGLLKAVRNHYIDSPRAESTLETGRPNACNLCHLDQTLQWTASQLAKWAGRGEPRLPAEHQSASLAVLQMLKGDAAQRALIAGNCANPDAQAASGGPWLIPHLAGLLDDPYPAVRYMASKAIRKLPGQAAWSFDFVGPLEARTKAKHELLSQWKPAPNPETAKRLLFDAGGNVDQKRFDALLKQRDQRILDLLE